MKSMKGKGIFFLLGLFTATVSWSQKINPAHPDLSPSNFKMDSLPNSEINIPIPDQPETGVYDGRKKRGHCFPLRPNTG
jgi:hypothetical protein